MADIIEIAINQKRRLMFFYNNGIRVVEPHAYGYDKNGNRKLRAYQVSGYSESGQEQGWKLFNVNEIQTVQILEEFFIMPREGYNYVGDRAISNMICKI
jgi:predicted DNA-binding transcriptional regulator YafY